MVLERIVHHLSLMQVKVHDKVRMDEIPPSSLEMKDRGNGFSSGWPDSITIFHSKDIRHITARLVNLAKRPTARADSHCTPDTHELAHSEWGSHLIILVLVLTSISTCRLKANWCFSSQRTDLVIQRWENLRTNAGFNLTQRATRLQSSFQYLQRNAVSVLYCC